MAIKIIKHGDHEHSLKEVNDTVFGLKINTFGTENISESFGWPDEKFDSVLSTYMAFIKFQDAAGELNHDFPKATKCSSLVDFLKSDNFKKLGVKITTPNDYFILGYIWLAGNMRVDGMDEKPVSGMIPMGGGHVKRTSRSTCEK